MEHSTSPVDDVERYGCGLRARRGRCVVINNHHFNHLLTNQRDRDGTEVDAAAAERLFVSLGFEVMRYDDLTINDIIETCLDLIRNTLEVDCRVEDLKR